ncbi:MAG: hypothetical protein V4584_06170 [Verrucomicrobiota bacterium]
MKNFRRIFVGIAFAGILPSSAEAIELLKTRMGREYAKVEVLSNDDVGVKIRHEAGTARIAFVDLPDSLQKKYKFDPKAAELQKAREAEELRQRVTGPVIPGVKPTGSAAVRKKPSPPAAVTAQVDVLPEAGTPTKDGDMSAADMAAYVVGMRQKIREVQKEIASLKREADSQRMKTREINNGVVYDVSRGVRGTSRTVPDKGALMRAKKIDVEVGQLELRKSKAHQLVVETKARYRVLTGEELVDEVLP